MEIKRSIVGALGASLLLAALPGLAQAQDDTATTPALEGVEWNLATLQGESLPEGVEVTLFLNGGDVVGNAGCNSYFGGYVLDGEALTFPQPFGGTRMLCDDAVMAVEDAYLPLLQATASWSIDDAGVLELTESDGTAALRYGEAPVEVTASDVAALTTTLEGLQQQIDDAAAEVNALAEQAAGINVNRFDRRLTAVEDSVSAMEGRLGGVNPVNLRRRIDANEQAITTVRRTANAAGRKADANEQAIAASQARIASLEQTVGNLRKRIVALEAADQELDARITALEGGLTPEQPLP